MVRTEYIIEYDKKLEMTIDSLKPIVFYLEKKLKNKTLKPINKLKYQDAHESILKLEKTKEIKYSYVFFFCFALAEEYIDIARQMQSNKISMTNLTNEEYWDNKEIEFHIGLFFVYSFFNELFSKILTVDMYKLMNKNDIYKEYWKIRKNLRKDF